MNWPPRVSQEKIRRLYAGHAAGLVDEELLDEVWISLYLRCEAILEVAQAMQGRVACRQCGQIITRNEHEHHKALQELLCCASCGWRAVWEQYLGSLHKRQFQIGGAGPAFQAYVDGFEHCRTPQDKMLLIDGLVHEFHRTAAGFLGRTAAVNVIEGSMTSVLGLILELAYGDCTAPQVAGNRQHWEREAERESSRNPGWWTGRIIEQLEAAVR